MSMQFLKTFGSRITTNYPPDDIFDEFLDTCENIFGICKDYFDYQAGATKIVLTNFDEIVYKFPYNGSFSTREENGKAIEGADETDSKTLRFIGFNGAVGGKVASDYCSHEISIYEAIPNEFKCFFAKLTPHTYGDIVYYEQERCCTEADEDFLDRVYEEDIMPFFTEREKVYVRDCGLQYTWIKAAIDYYGVNLTIAFIKWLDCNDDMQIIEDLHDENYGYGLDERPVIIDWGGYHH